MQLQEDFSLEAVLSIITGINCTNDFGEVFELFWFMFEDPLINTTGIMELKDAAKRHILNIHPELKTVVYNNKLSLNEWLEKQKELYGSYLTISVIGEPIVVLEKQPIVSAR